MPELTAIHYGLLALMLVGGAALGWIMRADRCAKEKIAVSAGWQDQLESQQSEHNRLAEQNKSLMEQISQYQASQKDYSNRAKELSESLKEAFARRDELQRQIKDIRGNLEVAVAQRDRLKNQLASNQSSAIKEKDDKIFRLSRELTSWQSRVPPLVEKFQERNTQALELEEELDKVRKRLHAMEDMVRSDQTRIEPVDAESLPDGGDASNEPIAVTSFNDASALQDQIDNDSGLRNVFDGEAAAAADQESSLEDSAFAAVFSDSDDEVTAPDDAFENEMTALDDASENEVTALDGASEDEVTALDDAFEDEVTALDGASENEVTAPDGASEDEVTALDDAFEDAVTALDGASENEVTAPDRASENEVTALDRGFENGYDIEHKEARLNDPAAQDNRANEHDVADDLKMIKGIGPSIEKTLRGLGIVRFHQIAEMSEYDIDRVAQQLRGFRSRIYREDWIGQARDLQYQKNNDNL